MIGFRKYKILRDWILEHGVRKVSATGEQVIIEALGKQIPKKPKIEIHENRVKSEQEVPCCPSCSQNLEELIGNLYCPNCGQAIDWSEENDE